MTDAALASGRIVRDILILMCLLHLGMARIACRYRIRRDEPRVSARMGIVAGRTIALRTRMLHFRAGYLFRHFVVTGSTKLGNAGLRKLNFPVLRGLVTCVTALTREWRMRVRLHQLGLRGLMRVVAGRANRSREWLPFMAFRQFGVF